MSDQNLPTDRSVRLTINFFPPHEPMIIDQLSSNATTWPTNCDFLAWRNRRNRFFPFFEGLCRHELRQEEIINRQRGKFVYE